MLKALKGLRKKDEAVAPKKKKEALVVVAPKPVYVPIPDAAAPANRMLMYGRFHDIEGVAPFPWPVRHEGLQFYACTQCRGLKSHCAAAHYRDEEFEYCATCNTVKTHKRRGTPHELHMFEPEQGTIGETDMSMRTRATT